jgi:hypothetical protein
MNLKIESNILFGLLLKAAVAYKLALLLLVDELVDAVLAFDAGQLD